MSQTKYKSTIADTTIIVDGSNMKYTEKRPIKLTIKAYELNYGPVIDLTITVDIKYDNYWSDHPFKHIDNYDDSKYIVSDIIDDTPAIRSIIKELIQKEPFNLYTTTDCTHRAGLIKALSYFWS